MGAQTHFFRFLSGEMAAALSTAVFATKGGLWWRQEEYVRDPPPEMGSLLFTSRLDREADVQWLPVRYITGVRTFRRATPAGGHASTSALCTDPYLG